MNATAAVAINPPSRTSIGNALLLGLTSVGSSALLTTRSWILSFTGIFAASWRASTTSRKAFVAASVSLVALAAGRRRRGDRHHRRRSAADRGHDRAPRRSGLAPFSMAARVDQATALEHANDRVARREGGVDVDQTREPTRVGEGRAAARDRGREAPTAAQALPPASARASPGSTRSPASGRRSPTARPERRTARPTPIVNDDPDDHDRAVTPKNIRVQSDVDLVPSNLD